MKQGHYLELQIPRSVQVASDSESPFIIAAILKILKHHSLDELMIDSAIEFAFGYGFINSKDEFILLERTVHIEFVCDVPDDGTGFGINPVSRQREKSGSWLSRITSPDVNQPNRTRGDYRMSDLYQHLKDKYDIKGAIKKEAQ